MLRACDEPRSPGPPPYADRVDAAEHRARWSAAHGGASAGPALVRWWLGGLRALATPLARAGVSPDALTATGLLLSLAVVVPAAVGSRAAIGVPAGLALAGLMDGLDGAVAVLAGAGSARGAVLDAVADRLADAAALVALGLLGAPWWLVATAVGAGELTEYARARAQAAGVPGPGAVTVSERPTRVAVAAMFALGAGLYPASAPGWALAGAVVAAVLAAAGLLHVLVALARALHRLDRSA